MQQLAVRLRGCCKGSEQLSVISIQLKKQMTKSVDFRFYLITDRKQVKNSNLLSAVKKALAGGIRAVQLREKDLDTRDLLKLAFRMRELTRKYDAKLFINDRFDIALAVNADGVHLTRNSIPVDAVRKTVGEKLLIGASTHSLKEARESEREGADFVTFGPVYRTQSKVRYGVPVGLDELERVCSKIKIPVFALGGTKMNRIKSVKKTGAHGVSMISELLKAENIKKKTMEVLSELDELFCNKEII
jgi:thiamine-phosphate pyrophosphorylase